MERKSFYMEKKKAKLFSAIALVALALLVVGVTYAYFQNQYGDSSQTDIKVTTYTTDLLTFETGDPINITADQDTFAKGKGNQTGSSFAKAILQANNKTNVATANYDIYLKINNNEFTYTTTGKPELVLQVTDNSGNPVTSIDGLTYVTITDGSNASISGFDITEKSGVITIVSNKEISASPKTEEQYNITLVLVNYDFDQNNNAGKSFDAKLTIQKYVVPPNITVTASNIPSTYGALANLSCTNGSATYNQKYQRIEISSINENINCNLDYSTRTNKTYLNDYIISLSGTTQGTGQVVDENGYRYEGKNPNNYVWFNNEYWRIIGVFDSESHGVSGKNLVKITTEGTLGGIVWDKSELNDWTESSLNKLLNGAYYNAQDGTDSGYCYGYRNLSAKCDYTQKGIQTGYRGMIANVTWYLGGYSDEATAEAFYGYERGTEVYEGNPTSTTGYIALMYPSDYGYSFLASSCARTIDLLSYSYTSSCGGQSWLYGKGAEWTISPQSSINSGVWNVDEYGNLNAYHTYYGFGYRPVLYLDASVYKIDGDGSFGNSYIIGM